MNAQVSDALTTEASLACRVASPAGMHVRSRNAADYESASRVSAGVADAPNSPRPVYARTAVVTRTKNRPILLSRALESVRCQTYRDFVWVVVNDGGERTCVDDVAQRAEKDGIRAVVLHHPRSLGMEAASNAAIHAVDSQYIVIHDDDDSWHPTFLERTTAYLAANPCYAGVVAHSMRVDEMIVSDQVRTLAKYPYNAGLTSLYLIDMLGRNSFPPIAFLYRRDAFDAVGDYDESLPVLGDWDFNVRFLRRYDIGVIPQMLSYYHHRVRSPGNPEYGNTVIAGIENHLRYDTIIRNRWLRHDLEAGRFGVGALLSIMRWQQIVSDRQGVATEFMRLVKRMMERIPGFKYLLRRLRG